MANAELKVIISAEGNQLTAVAKKAEADLQSLTNETKKLPNSLAKADASLSKTTKQFNAVGASVRKLNPQVSLLGNNIETLRAKALARKNFLITETDIGKIKVYNQEIKALEAEITRLQAIGTTSFGSIGQAGTKAFSSLRQLANILPGIGISGIIGGLTGLVVSLFDTGNAAKQATENLKEFLIPSSQLSEEAAASTQEELSKVTALSKAVLDQTKSYKERNAALNQLKTINESYFGDLTLETAALGLLKTRVDEYTQALINQAVIKAFSEQIGKLAVELSKQERAFNQAGAEVDKLKKRLDNPVFKDGAKRTEESARQQVGLTVAVGNASNAFDTQAKVVGKLRDQMGELRTDIQAAVNESLTLRPLKLEKTKVPKNANDDLKKFIAEAKQLNAELEKIGFIPPVKFSFFDSFQEEIDKARKVFDDFNKGKLKINPSIFTFPSFSEPEIKERVKEAMSIVDQGIRAGIVALPRIPFAIDVDVNNSAISTEASNFALLADKELRRAFKTLGKIDMASLVDFNQPVGLNFSVLLETLRNGFHATKDATREELIGIADEVQKNLKVINDVLTNVQFEGLATVGQALGAALAGGDVGSAFKAFGGMLADGVTAIGKELIKMSGVIKAIKVALQGSLNPVALLAGGIALIAIGAALRASLNKGVKGFAEGGNVFANRPILVGEKGAELFIPGRNGRIMSNKDSQRALSGIEAGLQTVRVIGQISGKDIRLVSARQSGFENRNV